MRLKSLQLIGFKSFIDKTSFDLDKGIICVVGPNGAGKSNIVDSIRWCMGEQRPKSLRGEEMGDVIFTGSDTRKPAGMSEVSLTFIADGGGLPAGYSEYDEIMVTRRIFKTGESEYFINKVPVRWRDVIDFFLDTGVGTKAYSIIDQGMVERIIMAKPDERRLFFEEAAGIMKYKLRKKAALADMESTQQNLQRVDDIMGELKRQINSLDRQAKKAERYKALKAELREMEFKLLLMQYRRSLAELELYEKELAGLKSEEASLLAGVSSLAATLEESKLRALDAEKEVNAMNQSFFNLQSEMQQKDNELKMLKKDLENAYSEQKRLVSEVAELKENHIQIVSRIKELNNEKKLFSGILAEKETMESELDLKLKAAQEENEKVKKLIEESRVELTDHLSKQAGFRNELLGLEKDIDERNRRLQGLHSQDMELRQNLGTAEASLSTARQRLDAGSEELSRLQTAIELQNRALNERKMILQEKNVKFERLNNDIVALKSRYTSQKEIVENYEGFSEGVRAIIQKSRAGETSLGAFRAVADILKADAEYEDALEAVLGERLQYVIVNNLNEGLEAINYLKQNEAGRATFLTRTNGLKIEGKSAYQDGTPNSGPVRKLLDLVHVEDGYEGIARFLLSDVIVVDDRDTALRLWKSEQNQMTIVTPDGDIFMSSGVFAGGSKTALEAGMLRMRSELSLMETAIREKEADLKILHGELEGLKDSITIEEESIRKNEAELRAGEIFILKIQNEIKTFEADAERFKSLIESQAAERNLIESEKKQIDEMRIEKVKGLEELNYILQRTESTLKDAEAKRLELESEISRLNAELMIVKTELASIREKMRSVNAFLEESEEDEKELTKKLSIKTSEISHKETFKNETIVRIKDVDNELKECVGRSIEMEKKLGEKKAEYNKLAELTASLDKQYMEKRNALDSLKERISNLNISVSERRLNIEFFISTAHDRCQKDLLEYRDTIVEENEEEMEKRVNELNDRINEMGEINLVAAEEFRELNERYQFLNNQRSDLVKSLEDLKSAIAKINRTSREKFIEAFNAINAKFKEVFPRFFNGGRAELYLTDEHEVLESGVEVFAQPPGKRLQNISLLSGGEKALTGIALTFSFFLIKPTPFCILDEADAPLDESNLRRFLAMVKELNKDIQFIIITHNKLTMEIADVLYGITMEEPGVSRVVSVKLN